MENKEDDGLEKLFGSRTRVKLLKLFFCNPNKAFFVREITRVVDEQINSVRRELTNLESLSVVKREDFDKKTYFTLNKTYRYAKSFTELFNKPAVGKKTESITDIWAELAKPVKSVLDGVILINRAVGENGVELLIVGNDRTKKLSKWASVVEKKQGRPVNYAILSKEDYYYRYSVRDDFLEDIFASDYNIVIDNNVFKKGKRDV
jgi:hypothetical protein